MITDDIGELSSTDSIISRAMIVYSVVDGNMTKNIDIFIYRKRYFILFSMEAFDSIFVYIGFNTICAQYRHLELAKDLPLHVSQDTSFYSV